MVPDAQDLQYVAAILQVTAVPAGALEFMSQESRQRIEEWLMRKLPRLVALIAVLLAVSYVMALLLVKTGPYLILIVVFFNRAITTALVWTAPDDAWASGIAILIVFVVLSVVAAMVTWVLPDAWVLASAYPFEAFSRWANGFTVGAWLFPDFSGGGFLDFYRTTVNGLQAWVDRTFWSWIAWFQSPYFFVARGAMLVTLIGLQLALAAGIVMAAGLVLTTPLYLFIKGSEFLKSRLGMSEGIPVGAFVLYSLGQCLDFAIESVCRFTSVPCG